MLMPVYTKSKPPLTVDVATFAAMSNVATRIKQRLAVVDISQADLARAIGVSRAAVTNWMNGTNKTIHSSLIFKMAKALRCSPDWLATGRGAVEMPSTGIDQAKLTKCLEVASEAAKAVNWDVPERELARLAAFLYSREMKHESATVEVAIDAIETILIQGAQ